MRILFFISFSLIIVNSLFSADHEKLSGGGGGMQFGIAYTPINIINNYLTNYNLKPLSGNMFSFGGNGHGIIRNFVIGGGMYRYNSLNTSKNNTSIISSSIQYGVLNIGYILFNSPNVIGYPVLGTGYYTYTLNNTQKTDLDFIMAIQNPDKEVNLKNSNMIIDFGWIFEYFPILKNKENKGGPCIGFKIGGFISPGTGNWDFGGGNILNAPKMRISGIYIRTLYKGYVFH